MKTTLFYYTGTGNSLWVAKNLAEKLGDTKVVSILDQVDENMPIEADAIGIIFPVYIWGVPSRVIRFVNNLKIMKTCYVSALAVNGGQVSNTLIQLKNLLKRQDIILSSGFEITMPSNYIPFGGPVTKERMSKLFELALIKISKISMCIKAREKIEPEKGPIWQRILFTLIYKLSFSHIHKMDKNFWVDEKCNKCGICVRVCPANNITLVEGEATWNAKCEQCLSCIQWCPKEAIQYGKKTYLYERYHHPEIKLKEIVKY